MTNISNEGLNYQPSPKAGFLWAGLALGISVIFQVARHSVEFLEIDIIKICIAAILWLSIFMAARIFGGRSKLESLGNLFAAFGISCLAIFFPQPSFVFDFMYQNEKSLAASFSLLILVFGLILSGVGRSRSRTTRE